MTETSREVLFDGGIYQRLGSIPLAVDIVPFRRRTFDERSGWLMSIRRLRCGKECLSMRPTTLFPSQKAHEWLRLAARDAFVMDLSRLGGL